MNIIGRYDKVRALWTTGQVGYPFILDNKWMQLKPAMNEEWWKSPDGYWIPIPRGGIGGQSGWFPTPSSILYGNNFSSPALTGIALNSASGYTFNSAGNAVGFRFVPISTFTIKNVYYYISAIGGTQANVNTVDFYLRNSGAAGGPNVAGGTIYTSGTANPNSDSSGAFVGWHKITPTQFTVYPGQYYYAILTRTQNATDFPTIGRSLSNWTGLGGVLDFYFTPNNTTNGFNTFTNAGDCPVVIFEDPNGNVVGNALTQTASDSTITRKGLRFILKESLRIFGMFCDVAGAFNRIELYDNTNTVPGTNPLRTSQSPGVDMIVGVPTLGRIQGGLFRDGVICSRNVPYRLISFWSSASFNMTLVKIGQNNSYVSQTRAAKTGGKDWYFTKSNGTTDWSLDDQDSLPMVGVLMDDQIAANVPASRIFTGY